MEWTDDLKNKLLKTQGKESEINKFRTQYRPDLKFSSIERFYREFRNKSLSPDSNIDPFLSFLFRGRTYKEIEEELGLNKTQVDQKISKEVEDYTLFKTRNNFQEELLIYLPKLEQKIKIKPKIWTYRVAKNHPWIWIQFPEGLPFSKINIVPMADVHDGAFGSLEEKFDEYLHWVAKTPNVFVCLVGDLLEFSSGESCRGVSIFEQKYRPKTQMERMLHKLAPIAHKILWAQPGNHEKRSRKYDFDPLEWICKELDIPYFRSTIYADILWNGYVFDFYCHHGVTNSKTKGGKINAAIEPTKWQDFTMFTIMAHVHDAIVNPITRICRDRVNFELAEKKQFIVICSSFMGYFGTYAEDAEYAPGSVGAISCKIYKNGDYHASS